jgi:hypothetical protein
MRICPIESLRKSLDWSRIKEFRGWLDGALENIIWEVEIVVTLKDLSSEIVWRRSLDKRQDIIRLSWIFKFNTYYDIFNRYFD